MHALALTVLTIAQPPAQAVPPVAAPPAAVADPTLQPILAQWERKMGTVPSLEADCSRTEIDKVTGQKELWQGRAKFLRGQPGQPGKPPQPDNAFLYMQKANNPQIFEQFVFTGTAIYEYRPQEKRLRVHSLPPPVPGRPAINDNFFNFLFGFKAADALQRFDMKLIKQDQWWLYIQIEPKLPSDKADFTVARLVLSAQTFLPRQLTMESPGGQQQIHWDVPRVNDQIGLRPADFVPPQPPKDWQIVQVPRPTPGQGQAPPAQQPPPSKVRPAGANQ